MPLRVSPYRMMFTFRSFYESECQSRGYLTVPFPLNVYPNRWYLIIRPQNVARRTKTIICRWCHTIKQQDEHRFQIYQMRRLVPLTKSQINITATWYYLSQFSCCANVKFKHFSGVWGKCCAREKLQKATHDKWAFLIASRYFHSFNIPPVMANTFMLSTHQHTHTHTSVHITSHGITTPKASHEFRSKSSHQVVILSSKYSECVLSPWHYLPVAIRSLRHRNQHRRRHRSRVESC